MKPNLRTCEAEGCQHQIPRWLLMCPAHWALVPMATKRDVHTTLKALKVPAPGPAFLPKRRAYLEACAAAVKAVAAKQNAKRDRGEALTGSMFAPDSAPVGDNELSKVEHGNTTNTGRTAA